MTKRILTDSMRRYTDNAEFITRAQLARYMGIRNPRNVDKYLAGLDCINGKYYLIQDVSSKLINALEVK